LDTPHLVEKRLVIELAGKRLLLLLGESVDEVLDLRKLKIQLNRHFHSFSSL
jgi:hypothetical protein